MIILGIMPNLIKWIVPKIVDNMLDFSPCENIQRL